MNSFDTWQDRDGKVAQGMLSPSLNSTYEMIRRSAERNPKAPALSFFLSVSDHHYPETWTYKQLLSRMTQTANLFHHLGVTKDMVIAFVLPNLPETQFVIWGGQAVGIVAAIDPQLEPAAIADLLNTVNATILVTLAPFPSTDLWPKMSLVVPRVKSLRHLVLVSLADRVSGVWSLTARALQRQEEQRLHGVRGIRDVVPISVRVHDFGRALSRQPNRQLVSGRVINQEDYAVFFCTYGTDGRPRVALRRHRHEIVSAIHTGRLLGETIGLGGNLFCGLPLHQAQSMLINGLLPFSQGAHVILGTPKRSRHIRLRP
jgi:fatty-acyl-CoA synthase